MKVFRIAALVVLFLLGVACLVWYFRTGEDADDSEKKTDSGMLLTDTSPLGELSVLSDRRRADMHDVNPRIGKKLKEVRIPLDLSPTGLLGGGETCGDARRVAVGKPD